MKLVKVQVKKYKCVDDSDPWSVDQITCLVGKNESGKTALLEALYKLNPVEESKAVFSDTDYPRKETLTDAGQSYLKNGDAVITHWRLESDDLTLLQDRLPELQVAPDAEVRVARGYGQSSRWHISIDEERAVKTLIESASFNASENSAVGNPATIKELFDRLEALKTPTGKHGDLLNKILESYPRKTALSGIYACLSDVFPHFVYFTEYERMPGKVSIDDMRMRERSDDVPFGQKIFKALLALARTGIDDLENTTHQEELIMKLEAVSNRITDEIFEYWSQNRHLKVEFRCEPGKSDDPPPFNSGTVFETRIRNERHRASVNFGERSTGFIWFFSFLVWFSQMKENYGDKLVVLLDEPGLTLHGKAQQDLLRYIKERLGLKYQVIYTTHSPFMLDGESIFSLRTVEDVVNQGEVKEAERIEGTKVGERVLSSDDDTILPLQGYIGYDIANTFFIGPYMLVVEGPSEVAYISWFNRQLVADKRKGLDIRWAVAPAEGAPKVTSFVTLFKGRGLKIAALMDYHEGQKGMVDRLEAAELMDEGCLLKTTDFVDQKEADIEDLIGWELYAHLVNESLGLPNQLRLPPERPEGATRIIKAVEEMTKLLPPAVAEFDHLKPAKHLHALEQDEIERLPGLECAIGRFAQLFERLNNLIR